ncbi:hypothetical protein J5N97_009979 [Dioscorea zingiberensis]|uniref:Myb/SANT-like domain-containing protein n=1 Tax=Dioscorea zingiberensis TaxID=325984 RepID=A0A9D5HM58_9LILI|nr:hypothetical protein J5N97_009979 [Dioscorea zingiberensis]
MHEVPLGQEALVRIWNAYQKMTNEDVTLLQLKGRWKTLKKLYKLYSSLVNKSGWSWDQDNHRPTPGEMTVWEEIIERNKEMKVCRDKPFPLYCKIHALVSPSTATGEYATHTGVLLSNLYVKRGDKQSKAPIVTSRVYKRLQMTSSKRR